LLDLLRRNAHRVGDSSSDKMRYVTQAWYIPNPEGHQDRTVGSKVMVILLK
jgi:hypothetical protein